MSVDEIKTKCIVVGCKGNGAINQTFNKSEIVQVTQYSCLDVIVRSARKNNEKMFANNYPYLCDQGRKAWFGILYRLQSVTPIPPKVMRKLFNTVVKPLLVYGSDVCGHNKNGTSMVYKVMLRFCRCVLNVKTTTSNIMGNVESRHTEYILQCVCYVLYQSSS